MKKGKFNNRIAKNDRKKSIISTLFSFLINRNFMDKH